MCFVVRMFAMAAHFVSVVSDMQSSPKGRRSLSMKAFAEADMQPWGRLAHLGLFLIVHESHT